VAYRAFTLAQQPALRPAFRRLHAAAWPAFLQDEALTALFALIYERFPAFQLGPWDRTGRVVAIGNAVPFGWNGRGRRSPIGSST
jgi:hypothetical protein